MNPILIDLPESIETARLVLLAPKAGLGQKLYETMVDGYEDYVKWLAWPSTCPDISTVELECRKHQADFILRSCIRYLILDKYTGEVIGRCAFPPAQANWNIPQFGISYFVRKSKRKHGFATEAVRAMATLAFNNLSARKIEIFCDVENTASIKIPLNLGFKLEYVQKGGWPRSDGALATLQAYSIFSIEDLLDS
ncbi:GNAT family N-acetyltransferase [Candidatus Bodocaedibacter vickermanii]|uniref:N-acetyltransferase n=1 Tax=Candidatus Bodocaedibacter vickermanii TaxID=2741701 RepID=A0A7L9RSF5_9PROT|nr:N-acetyltransferase [Candidatus Paracaedibacteraceae bacterium 'Lake Konstanz']